MLYGLFLVKSLQYKRMASKTVKKAKTIAYLRASTDKQDTSNQRAEILSYAWKENLKVDEFIEITISSRRTPKQRRIEELTDRLNKGDTLIVTELSRIGRSTSEVLGIINELIKSEVRIIIIRQGLDLHQHDLTSKVMVTMFSLFAELERDLISSRTKEALAAKKAKGVKLGKPKGTIQKSKYDSDLDKIKELLVLGVSARKIASYMGYQNHVSLNTYLRKRKIREELGLR